MRWALSILRGLCEPSFPYPSASVHPIQSQQPLIGSGIYLLSNLSFNGLRFLPTTDEYQYGWDETRASLSWPSRLFDPGLNLDTVSG
jgi:hypothetical protein